MYRYLILSNRIQNRSREPPHLIMKSVSRTYGSDVSKDPAKSCSTKPTPILTYILSLT